MLKFLRRRRSKKTAKNDIAGEEDSFHPDLAHSVNGIEVIETNPDPDYFHPDLAEGSSYFDAVTKRQAFLLCIASFHRVRSEFEFKFVILGQKTNSKSA